MVTPSNNRLYKGKEFTPQGRGYKETFVKPTSVVEQKRGALDVMTEALVAINPALNAIFSNQIKDAVKMKKMVLLIVLLEVVFLLKMLLMKQEQVC